jgi:GNAT superfamily N-acetyltransferase
MTRMDTTIIRQATLDDIPALVRLRRQMFETMGHDNPEQLDAADRASSAYFARAMRLAQFHGWLAVTAQGEVVGSGGAVIDQHPPGPNNLSGRVGYVMNVVTVPAYRRRGIARRMMQTILDWMEGQGIGRVALHATEMGRPLYAELGFRTSNHMQRQLQGVLDEDHGYQDFCR